jgi:hypothetical protein
MSHSLTCSQTVSGSGLATTSGSSAHTASALISLSDESAGIGVTRLDVPTIDVSAVKAMVLSSDQDVTVVSNGLQAEKATVLGACTGNGNATVIVTAVGLSGTPRTVSVAILSGDSAATVGGKIRTALGAVSQITDFFTVGGSGAEVILTRLTSTATDSTFNISIANGTSTGLTSAPTSSPSAGAGDDSISLLADLPYVWNEDSYHDNLFAADISSLTITAAAAATINLRAVQDASP